MVRVWKVDSMKPGEIYELDVHVKGEPEKKKIRFEIIETGMYPSAIKGGVFFLGAKCRFDEGEAVLPFLLLEFAEKVIRDVNLSEVKGVAVNVLSKLVEVPDNPSPEKNGGCITIMEKQTGDVLLMESIGIIPAGKSTKYWRLSLEKAERLQAQPSNVSSWQSRNPDQNQWSGAIVAGKHIISFSGLTEAGDEALMLEVALQLKWINWDEATTIAKLSKNTLFDSLHEKME